MAKKRYLESPAYEGALRELRAALPDDAAALAPARAAALNRFMRDGLPGPKVEEWKYSNLGRLAKQAFPPAPPAADDLDLGAAAGPRLVFVNGYFSENLSQFPEEAGLTLTPVSRLGEGQAHEALAGVLADGAADDSRDDSLMALNTALFTDGLVLRLAAGTVLAAPLEIVHLAAGSAADKALRSRTLIHLEAGARATLIEKFAGPDGTYYWTQAVSDIRLEAGARLDGFVLQTEGDRAVHMLRRNVTLAEGAIYENHTLLLGGELSRTEIFPRLDGEGAKVVLKGAYMGRDGQSHDIYTRMTHARAHCDSTQVFRGVLDKGGKGAFQGRVIVEQDAQKTNADQSCKNLLLSRQAEANAKPELLIFADDVKCSHGATVGELDKRALFYLQSRGLSPAAAKALLVQAFTAEVFEAIEDVAMRDLFLEQAGRWLAGAGREVAS